MPTSASPRRHRATDRGAVDRVVDGVLGVRAEIVDVVIPLLQHPDEMLLERVAGVVAADCDAHPASVPRPRRFREVRRACRTAATSVLGVDDDGAAADQPEASAARPTRCAAGASHARCTAGSGSANKTGDMRFAVSNRIEADARLAQSEPGPPRPEAFVEPRDLEPEQQALYRAARARLPRRVRRRRRRAIVDLGFRTALPELGVELSSNLGIAAELDDGGRELRKVLVGARRDSQAARPRRRAHRARCAPRSGRPCSSTSSPST